MDRVRAAIEAFKLKIGGIYGARLRRVVLYGSHARGDARPGSDVDLAVVLEGPVWPGGEIDRMIDAIEDVCEAHGVLLAVYPVSEEAFRTVNSPLLINIRREGVPA